MNIDGHVPDNDALLRRLDPEAAPERLARLRRFQEEQARRSFTFEQVQALLRTTTASAAGETGTEPEAEQAILRCLSRRADGSYELRPDPITALALWEAIERLEVCSISTSA